MTEPPGNPPLAGTEIEPGEPWQTVDWDENPNWDFISAADDSPQELYALSDGAVRRSRTARMSLELLAPGQGASAALITGSPGVQSRFG
jgi:hypothetical protein